MEEQVWSIKQIVFDTVMLIVVGVATPIVKMTNQIFKRGFFCNDENLMHPMKGKSTVETQYFHPVACLLNIVAILLIEFLRQRKSAERVTLWRLKLPKWFHNSYYILLSFAFGILTTILITTVLKGSVGRLRPFFFIDCLPNVNCTLPENQHIYHTNYECTNKKFKQNTRLSFPSAHASFAMYCAIFLIIFIHKRLTCDVSKLLKSAIEFLLLLLALYVGVSRISDYKHFWGDVIGGFLIGGLVAIGVSINLYWPFAPCTSVISSKKSNSVLPQSIEM